MWKAGLLLVLLFVTGHFAVRYLRTNPLDPVIESRELRIETSEHAVRFAIEGPIQGSYLVTDATSQDWSDHPSNASLSVVGLSAARDYLRAYPDRHSYGSTSGRQLENLAAPLALIAASRPVYSEIRSLIDAYERRLRARGEWLCFTVSGDVLRVTAAESLGSGSDSTQAFLRRADGTRLVLARELHVQECAELASDR